MKTIFPRSSSEESVRPSAYCKVNGCVSQLLTICALAGGDVGISSDCALANDAKIAQRLAPKIVFKSPT